MQEQNAVNQQMEKDQVEKFREQLPKKFRDHQVIDQQIDLCCNSHGKCQEDPKGF